MRHKYASCALVPADRQHSSIYSGSTLSTRKENYLPNFMVAADLSHCFYSIVPPSTAFPATTP